MKIQHPYLKLFFAFIFFIGFNAQAQTFTFVKDINLDGDSQPMNFYEYNSNLYFSARDTAHGQELWQSDGSSIGTDLFKDILLNGHSAPNEFTDFNGKLYFEIRIGSYSALYESDETTGGTKLVKMLANNHIDCHVTKFNSHLYFFTNDGGGLKVWKSDGSSLGTNVMKSFPAIHSNPGIIYYRPSFKEFAGKLYFLANDSAHGVELWCTDGTSAGTNILKDINPFGDSKPHSLIELNGKLLFMASGSYGNDELWISDGSSSGTVLLKEINPLTGSGSYYFTRVNNKVFFSSNDGTHGRELWLTDGTTIGTVLVKDLNTDVNKGANPFCFMAYKGKLCFLAIAPAKSISLWESDGTAVGTKLVRHITERYIGNSMWTPTIVYNDKMYFIEDSVIGSGDFLWESDGTSSGTRVIQPSSVASSYTLRHTNGFYEYKGELYFDAHFDNKGRELWKLSTPAPTAIYQVDNKKISFNIFPNPANESISVKSNLAISEIGIRDITGRMVNRIMGNGEYIDVQNFRAGTYFLEIKTKDGIGIERFVKSD